MKPIGFISSTALFLLLGMTAPADAQEQQQEKQDQKAQPRNRSSIKGQHQIPPLRDPQPKH